MDRCDVGFGFGVVSGVISLLQSSIFFAYYVFSVRMRGYVVAGYLVAAGLSLLVLWAAFKVYKGQKVLGGTVMFATSLSLPVSAILFMLLTSGIIAIFIIASASFWFLFSMIGGILILSKEMKQKRARAIVYSTFAGVLALFITPIMVVLSGISNVVSPGMPIFYISFGVIPFIAAILTFVLLSVERHQGEAMKHIPKR